MSPNAKAERTRPVIAATGLYKYSIVKSKGPYFRPVDHDFVIFFNLAIDSTV
jgi:hypothetical protein